MKKYLPLILLGLGIVVLTGAFLFIRGRKSSGEAEESATIELSLNERPVTSLTPSEDGHWLKLNIDKIIVKAASLDYELLYKLPDGRTQGVPGTIKLEGQTSLERDLLLGSESSGKFRYDEGVEDGTLTLRFRNDKGRLLTKLSTDFHLQNSAKELTSVDGKFTSTLAKASKDYFVTMETFGIPDEAPGEVTDGPYGVFTSSENSLSGSVSLANAYRWTGSSWSSSFSVGTGIFIGIAQ